MTTLPRCVAGGSSCRIYVISGTALPQPQLGAQSFLFCVQDRITSW
jgi:hypothetical protein